MYENREIINRDYGQSSKKTMSLCKLTLAKTIKLSYVPFSGIAADGHAKAKI